MDNANVDTTESLRRQLDAANELIKSQRSDKAFLLTGCVIFSIAIVVLAALLAVQSQLACPYCSKTEVQKAADLDSYLDLPETPRSSLVR